MNHGALPPRSPYMGHSVLSKIGLLRSTCQLIVRHWLLRQTDRQTHDDSIYSASIASRGKNSHHTYTCIFNTLIRNWLVLIFEKCRQTARTDGRCGVSWSRWWTAISCAHAKMRASSTSKCSSVPLRCSTSSASTSRFTTSTTIVRSSSPPGRSLSPSPSRLRPAPSSNCRQPSTPTRRRSASRATNCFRWPWGRCSVSSGERPATCDWSSSARRLTASHVNAITWHWPHSTAAVLRSTGRRRSTSSLTMPTTTLQCLNEQSTQLTSTRTTLQV